MKHSVLVGKIIIYSLLIILSIIFILPFIWMFRSSFMQVKQIYRIPTEWIPKPFTIENYVQAFTVTPFLRYAVNTLIIVFANMIGILLASSISAFGFSRLNWKGRNLIFSIILSSMMLPGAVTLIPQFIGWNALGFFNTYVPLILPAYLGGGAFNIFLFKQFFMTLPAEIDEAALVDGASYFRIYWSIILPLSKSVLIVVAIFTFMGLWNDFFNPLIYLLDQDKFTLAIGLQFLRGQYTSAWHVIMAASTIIVIPCIFVFLFGQKFILEGVVMSGLKG